MTRVESRLVGYLSWVDDEDFRGVESAFLARLRENPGAILSPPESRFLAWLHRTKGY